MNFLQLEAGNKLREKIITLNRQIENCAHVQGDYQIVLQYKSSDGRSDSTMLLISDKEDLSTALAHIKDLNKKRLSMYEKDFKNL